MRKGRSHASLNKAIDDLLGGDDDVSAISHQKHASKSTSGAKKSGASSSPKKTLLTATSSSKDFYSSLSAIAGHDVIEDGNEEDVDVNPEDAAQVAKDLADMDDLESDLFGSFGGKKSNQKNKGSVSLFSSKQKKKTNEFADFDEDDPLAGLGLSDEEDNVKVKSKKPDLSRKLSQTSSKAKVDPNLGASNSRAPDTSPVRSSSFDKEDPFLATDPRPRSGSGGDKMMRRLNSWDDPSVGTQSESEITPRSRSNSGTQQKHSRKGSKKKKVNPVADKPNDVFLEKHQEAGLSPRDLLPRDPIDAPDTKPDVDSTRMRKKPPKKPAVKDTDDIFTDDDDLPGLSGDEITLPTKKIAEKQAAEEEPVRKATSALDDLLGGKPRGIEQKGRKPTFLEQMMSKPGGKGHSSDLPIETESPITSPREKEVKFGGYSPSVGVTRPTTAPNKRSVRFADELGFDELDFSFSESRPSSAPDGGRAKRAATKSRDISAGSSFEDENTDISLELSSSDFRKTTTKQGKKINIAKSNEPMNSGPQDSKAGDEWLGLEKDKEAKQSSDGKKTNPGKTSPRRSLQASRRNKQDFAPAKEDDLQGQEILGSTKLAAEKANRAETIEPAGKIEDQVKPTLTKQTSKDDWLGLGDEDMTENILTKSKPKPTKETPIASKQSTDTAKVPEDELFPWETPGRSGRQRRANFSRRQSEQNTAREEASSLAAGTKEKASNISIEESIKEPTSHSTPLDSKKTSAQAVLIESNKDKFNSLNNQPPSYEQHTTQQQANQQIEYSAPPQQSEITHNRTPYSQIEQPNQGMSQSLATSNQQLAAQMDNGFLSYGTTGAPQVGLQDAVLAQMVSADGIRSFAVNPVGINSSGFHQTIISPSNDRKLLSLQMEKLNAEKKLHQQTLEQYQIANSQMEQDRRSLESELRDLQSKISTIEDGKIKRDIEASKKIEDLENEIRKLKNEKEVLISSQELSRKRHEEERRASENSYKSRLQMIEDTYKNRESQIKDENAFYTKQSNERIKIMENEKTELISANKERITTIEKNKELDIERIKALHKKAMEELRQDYEEQLQRLHHLKEQEIAAATSMFSQTKSLQSLIQQVHNSTSEMEQLQKRMGVSHKDNLYERETSLRMKDEYLKTMQERLHRQETENAEERARLQSLVAKLEMQLREQGRQFDQDKWKLTQNENRVVSLQAAVEEERKYTMQQLAIERQMIEKSRDELMNEQRKILSECHEERRKLAAEKSQLEALQEKYSKENLEREHAVLKDRESKILKEEERLERERNALELSFKTINEEKQKLEEFAKAIQKKSKEVEIMSKDAVKLQQEGLEALEQCHILRLEIADASSLLETRSNRIEQQENALKENQALLKIEQTQLQVAKGSLRCALCQRAVGAPQFLQLLQSPNFSQKATSQQPQQQQPPLQLEQQFTRPSSPPASLSSSSVTTITSINESQPETRAQVGSTLPPPPDILVGSLNFNRTVRKWSADKEQDEDFFEEERRFLNEIQKKRDSKLSGVTFHT
ncbi:fas-binding factor 1-like isoform X1 [Rhopilema esculentum]|uniref:fas-binding factor 1-like isoform X1 n=2 Tax=Rhopilema esculentum TaxID=499914 RepID=UPI0031D7B142